MKEKTVIILRGVSGSGKSTFTELVSEPKVVISADDFFTDEQGNYNWKGELLGRAHADCRHRFDFALKNDKIDNIIISNVNAKSSDWKYYEDNAREAGVKVVFVVLENRHGGKNIHNVPQETLDRQENSIKQNLKLV